MVLLFYTHFSKLVFFLASIFIDGQKAWCIWYELSIALPFSKKQVANRIFSRKISRIIVIFIYFRNINLRII